MAWSKVTGKNLPLKWWFYKIMCEMEYHTFYTDYYYWLNKVLSTGYNLYGEKI